MKNILYNLNNVNNTNLPKIMRSGRLEERKYAGAHVRGEDGGTSARELQFPSHSKKANTVLRPGGKSRNRSTGSLLRDVTGDIKMLSSTNDCLQTLETEVREPRRKGCFSF